MSVSQKWIFQNSTKGDPLDQQGVESLMGGGHSDPLNPLLVEFTFKSQHLRNITLFIENDCC